MAQFEIADAEARFAQLVQKALQGEEVIIARDDEPLLKLVPVARTQHRAPGSGRDQVLYIATDFDAVPGEFDEDA